MHGYADRVCWCNSSSWTLNVSQLIEHLVLVYRICSAYFSFKARITLILSIPLWSLETGSFRKLCVNIIQWLQWLQDESLFIQRWCSKGVSRWRVFLFFTPAFLVYSKSNEKMQNTWDRAFVSGRMICYTTEIWLMLYAIQQRKAYLTLSQSTEKMFWVQAVCCSSSALHSRHQKHQLDVIPKQTTLK